jgi:RNA polymerase-binding transcription factor DksA
LTTHIGDAGADAYDRDFALTLLSEGTNALVEIDHALARIDAGTYGFCEMSGRPIPERRLKAIPFARYSVECQSQVEKDRKLLGRTHFSQSPVPFWEDEVDQSADL